MRLPFWSRPAPDERQHAIAALKSLGTTSVPGLAAALSWTVPHTEQVLGELLRHGPAGLAYDMRTGTIRWGPSPAPPTTPPTRPWPPASPLNPHPAGASSIPRDPARPAPGLPSIAPSSTTGPLAYRPSPSRSDSLPPPRITASGPAPGECARCHTPVLPTGTGDVFACPMCGRQVTSSGTLVSPSPSRARAPPGPDPKIQQLIAAWATGQPTPCPHCHQPLRHTSDGEFRCGSCGARIAYGTASKTPGPPSPPGGPMIGPTG